MSSSALVNTYVSKLAQDSLREVRRLRIILTRLLSSVTSTVEDDSDGTEEIPECEARSKRTLSTNLTSNSNGAVPDSRSMVESPVSPRGHSTSAKKDVLNENLQPHRLISQIR